MPAYAASLRITDTYRIHVRALRQRAVTLAEGRWSLLDPANLDRSHATWVAALVPALQEFQRAGARLSLAYLTAYLRSETGKPLTAALVDPSGYAGRSRAGKPLAEALVPTLYTVKSAIGEGRDVSAALKLGLDRAARVTGEETVAASRAALADGIRQDGRIIGWRRVTGGGCGACIAAATGAIQGDDELLEVHDHCQCTKEPVVADVPDDTHRPTGPAMFRAMPAHDQDALLGPEKADLLRTGAIGFHDLIKRDPMAVLPDGISEAPLQALQARQ